eukprot:g953.t1
MMTEEENDESSSTDVEDCGEEEMDDEGNEQDEVDPSTDGESGTGEKVIRMTLNGFRAGARLPPVVVFPYPPALGVPQRRISGNVVHQDSMQKKKNGSVTYYSKWKRHVISQVMQNAGLLCSTSKWKCNVCWDSQKPVAAWLKRKKPYGQFQKVNHFPGTWALGRKDELSRHVKRMQRKHGRHFRFIPETWIVPGQEEEFCRALKCANMPFFIKKPLASSRGRGIKVIHSSKASCFLRKVVGSKKKQKKKRRTGRKKRKKYLVQRYLHNPLLINGLKSDIRLYVLVTSFDPLVLFLYREGVVRFCTSPYSLKVTDAKHLNGHLTNYSVNKKSDQFVENTNADVDGVGHKWSLSALLRHIHRTKGADTSAIMKSIERCIVKTFIAAEEHVVSVGCRASKIVNTQLGGNCFELFGFDIMLDEELKPWLIECNVSPSLTAKSPLDKRIKGCLIADILHLAGVTPGQKKEDVSLPYVKGKRSASVGRSDASSRLQHAELSMTSETC